MAGEFALRNCELVTKVIHIHMTNRPNPSQGGRGTCWPPDRRRTGASQLSMSGEPWKTESARIFPLPLAIIVTARKSWQEPGKIYSNRYTLIYRQLSLFRESLPCVITGQVSWRNKNRQGNDRWRPDSRSAYDTMKHYICSNPVSDAHNGRSRLIPPSVIPLN